MKKSKSRSASPIIIIGVGLAILIGLAYMANNLTASQASTNNIVGNLFILAKLPTGSSMGGIYKSPPIKSPYSACQSSLDIANKTLNADTSFQKNLKSFKSLTKTSVGSSSLDQLARVGNNSIAKIFNSYNVCVLQQGATKSTTNQPISTDHTVGDLISLNDTGQGTEIAYEQPPTESSYADCQDLLDTANQSLVNDIDYQTALKKIKELTSTPDWTIFPVRQLVTLASQRTSEIYHGYNACVIAQENYAASKTTPPPVSSIVQPPVRDLRIITQVQSSATCQASLKSAQIALQLPKNRVTAEKLLNWETLYGQTLIVWQQESTKSVSYFVNVLQLKWQLFFFQLNWWRELNSIPEVKAYYDCIGKKIN